MVVSVYSQYSALPVPGAPYSTMRSWAIATISSANASSDTGRTISAISASGSNWNRPVRRASWPIAPGSGMLMKMPNSNVASSVRTSRCCHCGRRATAAAQPATTLAISICSQPG